MAVPRHLTQADRALIPGGRGSALPAGAVAAAAVAVAALGAVVLVRPRRVVVDGISMLPTLAPGDRLVLVRAGRLRAGDVVAAHAPGGGGHLLVKRVADTDGGRVVLCGDNPAASTDSRHFGPVARSAVVGRVVRRYAPAHRAGPLAPRRRPAERQGLRSRQ